MSDLGPVDPGHGADLAWLRRWRLHQDGDAVTTASSRLIPVSTEDGTPAMLKIAHVEEEARGADLLVALEGHGAARVLRRDGRALLLERAMGDRDLVEMVRAGSDDEATRIVCSVAGRLHRQTGRVLGSAEPPDLVVLETWFRRLFEHADALEPLHRAGASLARRLLDEPGEPVVLHGDLHHANVLDFGEHGWLAIDPKGLVGDAEFDVCNLLCNPHDLALAPGRLARQFAVVVEATGFDERRLRDWLVAWCALSSTWFALDDDPERSAAVARIGELAAGLDGGALA
ncbi:streptomycin 6-kinase [Agromyces flavus]|uniref:Streptomycin 6-kinase n=1 Tax=Agromyces flavus TaxID=589382 RepID=A0A1H1VBH7_9MICO|nr:aminoglycoside phosphotransferase family protein [Agromyces flavus]MCP2365893.1 streptomycin 6-kinase [Agromyces flavus]GGI43591.1 streptomycin 3''-phosphotransferase [Agromyces flavus]SDS82122.1 streptomycin 6-kinase [Agromyces flavus]